MQASTWQALPQPHLLELLWVFQKILRRLLLLLTCVVRVCEVFSLAFRQLSACHQRLPRRSHLRPLLLLHLQHRLLARQRLQLHHQLLLHSQLHQHYHDHDDHHGDHVCGVFSYLRRHRLLFPRQQMKLQLDFRCRLHCHLRLKHPHQICHVYGPVFCGVYEGVYHPRRGFLLLQHLWR